MPTSWSVFLIWTTVVKIFFTRREFLCHPPIVFCGPLGLLGLLSLLVLSFFLRMHQIGDLGTPNGFAISQMGF